MPYRELLLRYGIVVYINTGDDKCGRLVRISNPQLYYTGITNPREPKPNKPLNLYSVFVFVFVIVLTILSAGIYNPCGRL